MNNHLMKYGIDEKLRLAAGFFFKSIFTFTFIHLANSFSFLNKTINHRTNNINQ